MIKTSQLLNLRFPFILKRFDGFDIDENIFINVDDAIEYIKDIIEGLSVRDISNIKQSIIARITKTDNNNTDLTNKALASSPYKWSVLALVTQQQIKDTLSSEQYDEYMKYLNTLGLNTVDIPILNIREDVLKEILKEDILFQYENNFKYYIIKRETLDLENVYSLKDLNNLVIIQSKYNGKITLEKVISNVVENFFRWEVKFNDIYILGDDITDKLSSLKLAQRKDKYKENIVDELLEDDELFNYVYDCLVDAELNFQIKKAQQLTNNPKKLLTEPQRQYITDLLEKVDNDLIIHNLDCVSKLEGIHIIKYLLGERYDENIIQQYLL